MIRRLISGLGTLVVLFHGWLLATQLWDGRLADLTLLCQWLVACGLVAGLWTLQRSGTSVLSRRGVALWLLAALLHGPAVATVAHAADAALPEAATAALQVAQVAGTAALALGFLLLALAARRGAAQPHVATASALSHPGAAATAPGFAPTSAARPPPLG